MGRSRVDLWVLPMPEGQYLPATGPASSMAVVGVHGSLGAIAMSPLAVVAPYLPALF